MTDTAQAPKAAVKAPLDLGIEGLYCAACVGRSERVLRKVAGVEAALVNLSTAQVQITPNAPVSLEAVDVALKRAGYGLSRTTTRFEVSDMTCASCVQRIEKALGGIDGVFAVSANLADQSVQVAHFAGGTVVDRLRAGLAALGYPAQIAAGDAGAEPRHASDEIAAKSRFLWALALSLPVFVLEMGGHMVPAFHHWLHGLMPMGWLWGIQAVLTTLVLLGPGRLFLTRGLPALWRLNPDMNSLVALGTVAAWAYSMVALLLPSALPAESLAVYFEPAAVIVTLILLGRWLEARARGRTGAAIRKLMDLQPDIARVETPEGEEERPAARLQVGDILRLRPGERLAADGVVLSGESYIDESMITGEPVPALKAAGDEVTAGTVNGAAALRVEVLRAGQDTRLHDIVRMVTSAQAGKLPIQALVDRVTAVFVPVVMAIALVTVIAWLWFGGTAAQALVAGVSVLIVACPCAMGLATPTSILVGTGRAASLGILFRKGEALQRLASVTAVGFDKTGTLTEGRPSLTDLVLAQGISRAEALRLAAAVEAQSEHPIAHAICAAALAEGVKVPQAEGVTAIVGAGLQGMVEGAPVLLGNGKLMAEHGLEVGDLAPKAARLAAAAKTVLYMGTGGRVVALFAVADPVKAGAGAAIAALKEMGLSSVMISGDQRGTAEVVGAGLGITRVHAEVLPADKAEVVKSLGKAAFVGDGINDAPALAAADVGIAVGHGTDIAIEAADVVITSGDPRAVPLAVELARATLGNIRQNLFWAFAYNAALIPIAAGVFYPAFGWQLSPMLAAGAMALSSVFVLSNALRLRAAGSKLEPAAQARLHA